MGNGKLDIPNIGLMRVDVWGKPVFMGLLQDSRQSDRWRNQSNEPGILLPPSSGPRLCGAA